MQGSNPQHWEPNPRHWALGHPTLSAELLCHPLSLLLVSLALFRLWPASFSPLLRALLVLLIAFTATRSVRFSSSFSTCYDTNDARNVLSHLVGLARSRSLFLPDLREWSACNVLSHLVGLARSRSLFLPDLREWIPLNRVGFT